ncbi:MAG: diaminohydroxyphosphoribosylaminopyrimidine deaminase [Ulvibacter sp.]|jgi:diaminohydroxyphosphoribosylaminopyrimidine deaminase/5-amino-6-(5-phosphoribosylamino)uracil reductase
MLRCIQLAKNGLGTTYPNPLVGSVIVCNERIIGEGWHHKSGLGHAEVNAISSVEDKDLLKEATIYVSLEPCSHHGKTPPCADLIIASGIKKVVVGRRDPNPKVAGKGIQKLAGSGCDVTTGVLEKECDGLNKRFFTFHQKKRPYIFLKWAESKDGFVAPLAVKRTSKKEPFWISNEYSRQLVHKIRTTEQAILVGTTTVKLDNPALTARDWVGTNPWRVVIDRLLKLPEEVSVLDREVRTIIITEKEKNHKENLFFEKINFSEDLAFQICDVLYRYQIQSLIVEGGMKTLQTFIDEELWDEAFIFKGNVNFENGIAAPKFQGSQFSEEKIKEDTLQRFKNHSK